jgi:hypothetical protein
VLRAYDRASDEPVGEWPIHAIELPELQRLFGETGQMYDSYPVASEHASALERATGTTIDLDRYAYFGDADAL